jgi:glycosyltransferase involved in cell wall biosynthesis
VTVLIVTPWDTTEGGVPRVVGNLAIQLERRGHRAVFLHPGESDRLGKGATTWGFPGYTLNFRSPFRPPDESEEGTDRPVKALASFTCYLPWTLWQLWRLLRAERVDVVNIHYPSEYYACFAFLKPVCGFRLVLSVHGADVFPHGRPRARYSWLIRRLVAAADAVILPSARWLEQFVTVFPSARGRGHMIRNGVDLDAFAPGADGLPVTHSSAGYVLCVAMLNRGKGIDVLLKAFQAVSGGHPGLELWLAGDGPHRAEFERLAADLRITPRTRFLGLRPAGEVGRLLQGCRAFVLPSRTESFGIAILEALASRKPVVATRVGGIPEIVRDGSTGLLVDPDDPVALAKAMEAVLDDPALAARLATNGYEEARAHFGWDVTASSYEALFGAVTAAGARS